MLNGDDTRRSPQGAEEHRATAIDFLATKAPTSRWQKSHPSSIYSRMITFSSEECTFRSPLYSMRPSLRNLFMK